MSTNNFFRSNLNRLYSVVQGSMIVYSKEIIIASLKDFFSKDIYYRYVADQWGFPKTVDQTDLPLGAGMQDNLTTRLFIGESYRFDGIFFPAIIVKAGSFKSTPISFNREEGTIKYEPREYKDSFGNSLFYKTPSAFVLGGAWEGSISIDVYSRSLRGRDDLAEQIGMFFTDIGFKTLYREGLIVKPPTIGGPSDADDRNDKLYKCTVSLDVRTEWRREIPIGNLVETINIAIDFGLVDVPNYPVSPNLAIKTSVNLLDVYNF